MSNIKKIGFKYLLTKRLGERISTVKFIDETDLLKHLEAMKCFTKWQLISIIKL